MHGLFQGLHEGPMLGRGSQKYSPVSISASKALDVGDSEVVEVRGNRFARTPNDMATVSIRGPNHGRLFSSSRLYFQELRLHA